MAVKKNTNQNPDVTETQVVSSAKNEPKFSKAQILVSKAYEHRRDLVSALLDDDKEYTNKEVDQLVDNFMKGQVK